MRLRKLFGVCALMLFGTQSYANVACLLFPISQEPDGRWIYYSEYHMYQPPNFTCGFESSIAVICPDLYYGSESFFCYNQPSAADICDNVVLPEGCEIIEP